jgi:hypothetical protein
VAYGFVHCVETTGAECGRIAESTATIAAAGTALAVAAGTRAALTAAINRIRVVAADAVDVVLTRKTTNTVHAFVGGTIVPARGAAMIRLNALIVAALGTI